MSGWPFGAQASRKRMYSWILTKALVCKTHRVDPWSALVYEHMRWTFKGLRDPACAEMLDVIHLPHRRRCRGPLQCTFDLLVVMRYVLTDDPWIVITPQGQQHHLLH
eukprot:6461089-Amphidinium_carterae.1